MNNIIISWDPAAKERVLLACHYDTRPHADQDPNPRLASEGIFLGANDGASGVALFMELGHHLRAIPKLSSKRIPSLKRSIRLRAANSLPSRTVPS